MFENYSNIYNDSNKYAKNGISQQEKKYLKKVKQQNKQNKYGLSGFSNSTINNNIGGLVSNSNIEAFGGMMKQSQFLETFQNQQNTQTTQTPQTLSGMNFGSPPPNPYPSNPSNMQNVSIQQINSQIQSLNSQNKLQAYNPKNPSNNVTTYAKQSEAVLSQNQLTDRDITNLISLTSEYNKLIQQYNQAQNSVTSNADNQVLSMNSTTNPYLGQNLEISGGQVYYITNAGIAQPYPSDMSPLTSQGNSLLVSNSLDTNTPTTINSTSAINATVYSSAGSDYISTNPTMQIGNTKFYKKSSGNEGTNVYANNSNPLSFTDASYVGCFNTSSSMQQQIQLALAPNSQSGNYTFQTCKQIAYDSGSPYFSFNVSNPTSQTGNCYLTNDQIPAIELGPSLNYTYTKLWSTNITPVSGSDMSSNYMSLDPLGNIVVCNSSGAVIWTSDSSNNSLYPSNYVGCYQASVIQDIPATEWKNVTVRNCWGWICWHETIQEPVPVEQPEVVSLMPNNVTNSNSNINTWESCGDYAYNNGFPYYAVNNFNQNTGSATCLVGSNLQTITQGGQSQSCQSSGQIEYGNGGNAVYSATNAPVNAFLTLQDNGMVTAFTGTTLQDQQTITWQLNYTGQVQMSSYQWMNNCTYYEKMQTGSVLNEGQYISSPNGYLALTMQNGNLVLYTSTNTPKCYAMTTENNQIYYTGDSSMNALYQMNIVGNPNNLGNIGYVDQNSVLYPYPQNLVGQGDTFTYMGNYDSSGIVLTNLPSGNSQVSVVNGNFSQPEIGNNSFAYITSETEVPGWNFNAVLLNNSSAWGYPIPYPNGNQCVSLQSGSSISQTLNLTPGTYTLTFYAVGRDCCDGILVNPISILLNGTQIYFFQPTIGVWRNFSTTFSVNKNGANIITFQGTATDDQSTAIQNINIVDNGNYYTTVLDLSSAMQQCINTPNCNAFVMKTTSNGNVIAKFMQTAFSTPTYSQSGSNYLARYPDPNSQLYVRNPTVNNSPYCNKSITGINSTLYSNYQTIDTPMNSSMKCVKLTTTDPELQQLAQQINALSSQLVTTQNNLMNKTMTVNQQEQLNEIILGRQFKEIDTVEAVQKKAKQNAVSAQNIKNDTNIVVLRENQSYTLWSVLAISIALISIHVIR